MRSLVTGAVYVVAIVVLLLALAAINYGGTWLLCGGQDPYWAGHDWSCPVKIAH